MTETQATEVKQHLTFSMGRENFALEISKVREVLDYTDITPVPRTPEFLLGLINLRGNVVPVVDLRLILGMEVSERTISTCIMILDVMVEGQCLQLGALADSVQEVVDIVSSEIEPSPELTRNWDTDYIEGLGKRGDGFVIILDIDRVLSAGQARRVGDLGLAIA